MKEILQQFIDNWQIVLEYLMMLVMYFLVFLYNAKVRNTKITLTTLFKDRVPYAEKQLKDAEEKYDEAVARIVELETRLDRYEKALLIFVESEKIDNGQYEEVNNEHVERKS